MERRAPEQGLSMLSSPGVTLEEVGNYKVMMMCEKRYIDAKTVFSV